MVFSTICKYVKKLNGKDNIESIKLISDARVVSRRDRKRLKDAKEASTPIDQNRHNHLTLVTDPIEDANLVLNFYNKNKKLILP